MRVGVGNRLVDQPDAGNAASLARRRAASRRESVEVGLGRRQAESPGQIGDLDERLAFGDLAAGRDDAIVQSLQRAGGAGQRALARVQAAGEIVDNEIGHSRCRCFDCAAPLQRSLELTTSSSADCSFLDLDAGISGSRSSI